MAGAHATNSATTLHGLLAQAARTTHGITFLARSGREQWHSYADLQQGATRMAQHLWQRGVRPGARVALVLPTGADFVHALFATQLIGAIAVPLYPPVRLSHMDEYVARTVAMLQAVQARVVISNNALSAVLAPVWRAADRIEVLRADTLGDAALAPTHGEDFSSTRDVDDIALLQFSSGTTAAPKAVALRPRQIISNLCAVAAALYTHAPPPGGQHKTVSWLPLYHDMGLMGALLTSVYDAAPLVLMPPEAFVGRPAAWLQAIDHHGATISAAPNFAYALCTERVGDDVLSSLNLSRWLVALNGAESVQATTMRAFADRFGPCGFAYRAFTPVYGLAEATLAVCFSPLASPPVVQRVDAALLRRQRRAQPVPKPADAHRIDQNAIDLVAVGAPLPGYAVRVVRGDVAQPQRCAPNEVGRVQVSGPSLMAGYWPLSPTAKRERWQATGDLGVWIDGALYLVGRDKDVLIVRGENIAPDDVERAVDGEPQVRTGCCIAGSAATGGATESIVLLVEVRGAMPKGPAAEALRTRLRHRVAQRAGLKVDTIALLAPGTLPRTSSGKKRRAEAMRRYAAGELHPPAPPRPWQLAWRLLWGTLSQRRRHRGGPSRAAPP